MQPFSFDLTRLPSPHLTESHEEWRRTVRGFVEREVAPQARILVLGAVLPDEVPLLLEHNITPVIVSEEHGVELSVAARALGRTLRSSGPSRPSAT